MLITIFLPVVLLLGPSAEALAQSAAPDLEQMVLACREIDKDKARLKCFDNALAEVLGMDPTIEERREEEREEEFGRVDSDDTSVKEISALIAEAATDQRTGRTIILLENGQVWQTISTGTLRRGFKSGVQVTIKEGALGGYQLYQEGRRGFRGVKRLR